MDVKELIRDYWRCFALLQFAVNWWCLTDLVKLMVGNK
jgi:hypothetical protein